MTIVLPITLAAAAVAALINFWLAIRVGQVRTAEKILMGDGGNDAMVAAMRAQANHVENAPFVVLLIGAIELAIGSATWLWAVMAIFMIGRVLHGLGMTGLPKGRMIGTLITFLTLIGLAGVAIVITYLPPAKATVLERPANG
jgi:uncharacterized membrane protein YecN with MAPEG domain